MRIENTTAPIAAFAAVCLATAAAPAFADRDQPAPAQAPSIARMARLPVTGLQVVETTDGELLFLSDNGRYALRGPALDLWHGARLVSFEETIRLAGRIDLARLKLDVGDLGAIDLGEGPEVVVFVDPLCPHCAALYAELQALVGTYRFRSLPIASVRRSFGRQVDGRGSVTSAFTIYGAPAPRGSFRRESCSPR